MPVPTATLGDVLVLERGALRVEIVQHPFAMHVRRSGRRLIRGLDVWAVEGEVRDQFIQFTEGVIPREELGLPERVVAAPAPSSSPTASSSRCAARAAAPRACA